MRQHGRKRTQPTGGDCLGVEPTDVPVPDPLTEYLVGSSPAPTWVYTGSGIVLAANCALTALLGDVSRVPVGAPIDEVLGPDVAATLLAASSDVEKHEGWCALPTPMALGPRPVPASVRVAALRDPGGAPLGFIAEAWPLASEIEESPGENSSESADLSDLTPVHLSLLSRHEDAVAILADGAVQFVNGTLCALLGQEASELVGRACSALLDQEGLNLVARAARSRGLIRGGHDLLYAGGGSVRSQSVVGSYRWDGRRVVVLMAHVRDGVRTPQAIQARQARYRRAMESLSEAASCGDDFVALGSAILDSLLDTFECDRVLLTAPCDPSAPTYSTPMCRYRPGYPPPYEPGTPRPLDDAMRGYMRRVLASKVPIASLACEGFDGTPYPDEFAPWAVQSHLACALRPPHGPPCLLALHQCRDGRRWASEDIDLLRDLSHRVEDLLGACYLLREVRGSEELLEQAVADLERSNADLERFAYAASHDLKEPLRAVTNSVQMLIKQFVDASNPEAVRLARHAVDGSVRMAQLIDGLLEYAKTGTQPVAIERVDLEATLQRVMADLEPLIAESQAEVAIGDMPVVRGEERMLRQVLQNLLANALRFRGDRTPEIRIAAQRSVQSWIISIEDNGVGFAPEDADRIFEVFETLGEGSDGRGTGLGLALCRRIVQRLGGSIWAEGRPGMGATFYVALPAA